MKPLSKHSCKQYGCRRSQKKKQPLSGGKFIVILNMTPLLRTRFKLRPCCVKLSQLALKDDGSASNLRELTDTATQLLDILQQKCRANLAFDENLADYVFFPVMQVLALCEKRLGRLAELVTGC